MNYQGYFIDLDVPKMVANPENYNPKNIPGGGWSSPISLPYKIEPRNDAGVYFGTPGSKIRYGKQFRSNIEYRT